MTLKSKLKREFNVNVAMRRGLAESARAAARTHAWHIIAPLILHECVLYNKTNSNSYVSDISLPDEDELASCKSAMNVIRQTACCKW